MAEANGVVLLEFLDRPALAAAIEELQARYQSVVAPGHNAHLALLDEEIRAYFARECKVFTVPLVTPGTDFQSRVWAELRQIPHGITTSYGAIASALGLRNGSRAVGRANGQNRISIVIPCHRVIAADGSLTGYGGGQSRKAFLLHLERTSCVSDSV